MIFTLGINAVAQGIMVLHTGGFAPQDHATDLMHWLAVERVLLGIPNAVFIWALLGAAIVVMLKRTPLGRYIYAIGNRESATYLSGVKTKLVIIACFAISGMRSEEHTTELQSLMSISYAVFFLKKNKHN